jgi:hypothetical protein
LKTITNAQAWLSDDPHKGRNTEGSRSITLLRVKSIFIFWEDVTFLFYVKSEDHILNGAHTNIHMPTKFIVLSEGK